MSPPPKTPLLLIEDQTMVRHGLIALINTLDHYHVAASAGSIPEALKLLQPAPTTAQQSPTPQHSQSTPKSQTPEQTQSNPQPFTLILSDYHLGDDTALGLFRANLDTPLPPVVLLTSVCNAAELQHAIVQGVRGLLYKECDASELARAFDAICAGSVYFASGLGLASATPTPNPTTTTASTNDKPQLTPTEKEILQWLATGMSNKEIARLLGKSAETVKIQVSQLLRKLDCKTRTEAVVNASRRGLI